MNGDSTISNLSLIDSSLIYTKQYKFQSNDLNGQE